jgi:hypothetical protein
MLKKIIFKSIVICFFATLISVNISSESEFSFGTKAVEASVPVPFDMSIPCWSQIKKKDNVSTVWCSGCEGKIGWKDDGGESTCVQN